MTISHRPRPRASTALRGRPSHRRRVAPALLPALAWALTLGAGSGAHAVGYGFFQHGGRGVAQVGALVARADDPSGLSYNPAGLAALDGLQVSLGGGVFHARDRYQERFTYSPGPFGFDPPPPFAGSSASDPGASMATAHLTWSDEARLGRFAFGVGVDRPYLGRHDWGEGVDSVIFDGYGRYALELWQVHPVVAFRATDGLGFGAGLRYLQGDHALETVEPYWVADARGMDHRIPVRTDQGARISGLGFDVGAHYRTRVTGAGTLGAGVVYRSALTVEGDARRALTPLSEPPDAAARAELDQRLSRLHDSPFTSRAELPSELALGIWWGPVPALRLEVDAVSVRWSSYSARLEGQAVDGQPGGSVSLSEGGDDTLAWRLAVEGDVGRSLTLAAGFAREPSPISEISWRTPFAFRGDATVYGLGATWHRGDFAVDLGYSWLRYATVESDIMHPRHGRRESTFASEARVAAISVRQRF